VTLERLSNFSPKRIFNLGQMFLRVDYLRVRFIKALMYIWFFSFFITRSVDRLLFSQPKLSHLIIFIRLFGVLAICSAFCLRSGFGFPTSVEFLIMNCRSLWLSKLLIAGYYFLSSPMAHLAFFSNECLINIDTRSFWLNLQFSQFAACCKFLHKETQLLVLKL